MNYNNNQLLKSVIDGIQDVKGKNVTILDLKGVDGAIADYYVVCEGASTTQVDAIADSIEDKVRVDAGEKPLHQEGRTNAQWVLMDYHDVIVHIFLPAAREFYDIEGLWNDAKRTDVPNLE